MALVQHASGTATSGTTVTATFGSPTGSGNTIVVCATGAGSSAPVVSGVVLTGSSDTFSSALAEDNSTADITNAIWYDNSDSSGHTAVVVTFNQTLTAGMVDIFEWAGILVPSPLDKTSGQTVSGSGTTFTTTATAALAQPAEVGFGTAGALNGGGSPSFVGPSSPWTNSTAQSLSTNYEHIAGYQQVSTTTALTYSGTCSVGCYYASCIATFKLVLAPPNRIVQANQSVMRAAVW